MLRALGGAKVGLLVGGAAGGFGADDFLSSRCRSTEGLSLSHFLT